ncbi:arabinose-5-phosphate isomerase [Sphingomonas gellani]|uniref:Arabinose-5-phosphate isomerase n=1 Tax=Sphingomonas gellani TaxID=1166340 RepID=A0A1H8I7S0_9SPHN|nr:KpsF/GutQ family sugar-phosphate isomerase [Sphingomonas gellani]SEN64414.1 arabinose-5-phosphate isomerase [Sphingomonas gellani]
MRSLALPRTSTKALVSAARTIEIERNALRTLAQALEEPGLSEAFELAVEAIAAVPGRLIVTGMGKSGIIGRKVAATMTSTGTPSIYLHPGEASHGDLGMITGNDVVLALSWSGETVELGNIIAYCRRFGVRLIVMTAAVDSTAAKAADICLVLPHVPEACPNQLAPTSSTTVQTVLGDALAIALIEQRGFSKSDFLTLHPGGRLGARLTTVEQLMGGGEDVPVVQTGATLMDATFEMSRKRYGSTAVVDGHGNLVGVFTDGDLRRSFASQHLQDAIQAHMTPNPLAVTPSTLSTDALRIMNDNAITVLFVCNGAKLIGAVHLHDLLRAGVA